MSEGLEKMEKKHLLTAFSITAGLYSLNIVTDLLTGIALPAPLLLSILVSVGYLLYNRDIDITEAGLASAAFIGSGLTVSYGLKKTVYSDFCATATNLPGDRAAVLGGQGACKSTTEIFTSMLNSNATGTWRFWIVTLTASALTLYIYRNYYKTNSGTAPEPEPSSKTSS